MKSDKPLHYPLENTTPLQEKQLVRKVREFGDRAAFESIFRLYYKQLHGFAFSYVKSREHAEDIVQSVFLRIWSNKEGWNPPGKVRHYLFTAVRNEALNTIRKRQMESDSEEEIGHVFRELKSRSYTEDDPDLVIIKDAIQREIDRLPSRCREIYLLNRRSGLTYLEIADHLDISVNTVTTQMGRALKILRKSLSDYIPLFVASIFI